MYQLAMHACRLGPPRAVATLQLEDVTNRTTHHGVLVITAESNQPIGQLLVARLGSSQLTLMLSSRRVKAHTFCSPR